MHVVGHLEELPVAQERLGLLKHVLKLAEVSLRSSRCALSQRRLHHPCSGSNADGVETVKRSARRRSPTYKYLERSTKAAPCCATTSTFRSAGSTSRRSADTASLWIMGWDAGDAPEGGDRSSVGRLHPGTYIHLFSEDGIARRAVEASAAGVKPAVAALPST